ncbi:MAG: T9SS type A sorting domain-containing protein [Candidatus Marinimicrobia bacterium]|nr:T9SS type A sorting domain-containing protein [Candidatus Neomarinimicrobiota bacterium]
MDLYRCLVRFPLEEGKRLVSLGNADFFQLDSLSSPRIVYAHVDLPTNSSVTASIETADILPTGVDPAGRKDFPVKVYPNPFNPETCISFIAPEHMTTADIRILDIYGRTVHAINKKALYPGKHELIWNASGQPSGIYFISISGDIAGQVFSALKNVW